jgi:hypothetical protein
VAAENFATEQARAAISDAEHLYNLVEGDLFNTKAELQGSINTVEKAIPTVANEVVTSATPSILAKAAAAVQAKLTPIQTEINDCLTPLCDTVTPQAPRIGRLGNLLKGLEDLGIEALLVALAAECLANPAAVARDVDAVTKDIGDPLMAAYRDLIGA